MHDQDLLGSMMKTIIKAFRNEAVPESASRQRRRNQAA
jgi:hypothetical protein